MSFSNRETISIHIGQAGAQLGANIWELFCLEHNINKDGTFDPAKQDSDDCFKAFFAQTETGRVVPRSIFVDTEPTVLGKEENSKFDNFMHFSRIYAA